MSRNAAVTAGEHPARVPARVRTIEDTWIPVPDGTRLAARIWLREDAEVAPVPAILDFLPCQQGDPMAARTPRSTPTSLRVATPAPGWTGG